VFGLLSAGGMGEKLDQVSVGTAHCNYQTYKATTISSGVLHSFRMHSSKKISEKQYSTSCAYKPIRGRHTDRGRPLPLC
jgi:hypothetical protein